jgi:Flp pilus assembly protein TadB
VTARERAGETLAIVGFYFLVLLATVALFTLAPLWLALPAMAASVLVMVRRAE